MIRSWRENALFLRGFELLISQIFETEEIADIQLFSNFESDSFIGLAS